MKSTLADMPVDILIVEDSPTQAEKLKEILERRQYQVRSARNGRQALAAIAQNKPTLVITDINMPEMDGLELCRQIRKIEALADLPVILLTALSDPEDVFKGLECGADNFISKPYNEEYLHARIQHLLANMHLRQHEKAQMSMEVFFGGHKHVISSDRVQVLNLLFSSYETAVQKNRELTKMRDELKQLNEHLEERVRERTTELSESEERYRKVVELSPDGIFIQCEGKFGFLNTAAAKLFGAQDPVQLVGKPVLSCVHPDDQQLVQQRIREIEGSNRAAGPVEEKLVRLDGAVFNAEVTAAPFTWKGESASIMIFRDVSEKKKLETQLLRNQRLESLGTLASGISHDLNNVLSPIMMAMQLLKMNIRDPHQTRVLETVESSARRGSDLVKQVLTFARGSEGEKGEIQLKHLIREVNQIMAETFPKSIDIKIDVPKGLWTMKGDPTQLHQVLMNVCLNARDAMPKGGVLRISAVNFMVDENFARMNSEAKIGPYLLLTISDTGIGMAPEIRERIFEPFFTTKPPEKGTGLGLSTVRGIVHSHLGFITVYSETGKGTKFNFYFPALESPETEHAKSERPNLPMGSGECILVVDDEDAIREIAKQTLQLFGYQVLTASDGPEAVAIAAENKERLKLIVTDMVMPIMDGRATIRALRSINPRFKIIAASGLGSEPAGLGSDLLASDAFLTKPFTAETLLRTVHQTLQRL